jgi:5-oxoprolinase (ATP-hydrolysing) subunit A
MDVNCDLGESFGNWRLGADDELLPLVTTASLACGFHGGDPVTMKRSVASAAENGVAVGSHPGLPDLLGFGRRQMDISPEDLHAYIVYQSGALEAFLRPLDQRLNHVKPHGALYPMLNRRHDLAQAAVDAMFEVMDEPVLYWPAGSEERALIRVAHDRGVRVVGEFYPESTYGPDGETVVERERKHVTPDMAEAALRQFLSDGTVQTTDDGTLALDAESICIHGDGPEAAGIVKRVVEVLTQLGVNAERATDSGGVGR